MDILKILASIRPGVSVTFKEDSLETFSNVVWLKQKFYTENDDLTNIDVIWNEHAGVYTVSPFTIPTQEEIDASTERIKGEDDLIPVTNLRLKRNTALSKTDKYATTDYPHTNLVEQEKWIDHRQTLRDLPSVAVPSLTRDATMKLWVTNENVNSLGVDDTLISSNVSGFFKKGEPSVIKVLEECDFSVSKKEIHYSNTVNITQSNVYSNISVDEYTSLSLEEQSNYLECNYYSSNTISHYSNLMIYDNVKIYSNITPDTYINLPSENQSMYTPRLKYSKLYNIENPHRYVKVITHYSNLSVANTITYSNITQSEYDNLITVKPAHTIFTKTELDGTETQLSVYQYKFLNEELRKEYTPQLIPTVTTNLQPYYTRYSTTIPNEIKYITVDGVETDQSNSTYIAALLKCTM